jgi:hypothetical protein
MGGTWINKNQGIDSSLNIYSLLVANNFVYAGTFAQSVWRRAYTDIIGIRNISTEVPSEFSLEQNYPNPFNPVTKINFSIPKASFVSLKIFNVTGREVAELVNSELKAGVYESEFNAANLSSGIYFCRFNAGNFTDIKKLMLIK